MPLQAISTSWAAQNTTDAYVDLGTRWDKRGYKSSTIVIRNTGANGAFVKVLGSLDDSDYLSEVLTETAVAAGGNRTVEFSGYYPFVKIQIRAQVSGSQTTVSATAVAVSG